MVRTFYIVFNSFVRLTAAHKQILGRSEDALVGKVREARSKLPPTKIARDGSIMEWVRQFLEFLLYVEKLSIKCGLRYPRCLLQAQDFEDPDPHHRHVSHLFGLFPGHNITLEKTPDLCKAADNTLFKRGLL